MIQFKQTHESSTWRTALSGDVAVAKRIEVNIPLRAIDAEELKSKLSAAIDKILLTEYADEVYHVKAALIKSSQLDLEFKVRHYGFIRKVTREIGDLYTWIMCAVNMADIAAEDAIVSISSADVECSNNSQYREYQLIRIIRKLLKYTCTTVSIANLDDPDVPNPTILDFYTRNSKHFCDVLSQIGRSIRPMYRVHHPEYQSWGVLYQGVYYDAAHPDGVILEYDTLVEVKKTREELN